MSSAVMAKVLQATCNATLAISLSCFTNKDWSWSRRSATSGFRPKIPLTYLTVNRNISWSNVVSIDEHAHVFLFPWSSSSQCLNSIKGVPVYLLTASPAIRWRVFLIWHPDRHISLVVGERQYTLRTGQRDHSIVAESLWHSMPYEKKSRSRSRVRKWMYCTDL